MARRAENILAIDPPTPDRMADALDAAVKRVVFDKATPLAKIHPIPTQVPMIDYANIVRLLADN
jgi:hypothetical protein